MHLARGNVMAAATSIQNRLADVGDAILTRVIRAEDAGACCSDNGKICACVDHALCVDINPNYYIPKAFDCLCNCNFTNGTCQTCHVA